MTSIRKIYKTFTLLRRSKSSFLAFILLNCFNIYAQNDSSNVELKLKKLFFNLNVDTCQEQIQADIKSNAYYKFNYKGPVDTIKSGDHKFVLTHDILYPYYKLENNNQGIVKCDSTIIFLQRVIESRGQSHGKIDYEKLDGHSVSILMYFSDSLTANYAYKFLVDSISNSFNKEYSVGEVTIDNKTNGSISFINIDKKNNG